MESLDEADYSQISAGRDMKNNRECLKILDFHNETPKPDGSEQPGTDNGERHFSQRKSEQSILVDFKR
jgi:hypothetical protein